MVCSCHHICRSHLRSAAAVRRRSFHRCSCHSSRGRRAGSESRWRGRAARGERASAGPVSTRGDWPSLDCGPGVRVDGMARATSQSAKPRSWRHPPPPPQPTQPAPAQNACSDGEVGRASYARQTRARQHGAVNAGQKGPERCLTRETPTIFSASVRARGSCDGRKGVRPLGPRVPGSKRAGLRRRLDGHGAIREAVLHPPSRRHVGKFSEMRRAARMLP